MLFKYKQDFDENVVLYVMGTNFGKEAKEPLTKAKAKEWHSPRSMARRLSNGIMRSARGCGSTNGTTPQSALRSRGSCRRRSSSSII